MIDAAGVRTHQQKNSHTSFGAPEENPGGFCLLGCRQNTSKRRCSPAQALPTSPRNPTPTAYALVTSMGTLHAYIS